ncbi:hypothetical protein EVAR_77021_1 [Eumeta japonica]|uniref:CRAL-TRIO domain-containing protein n=1 Tax=Eumeta variegata TaxID=151549 RepID=A0A4C1SHH6_EUMVA|nr:hypothetical protein EVAR_77021_1 [Eumeta japonica]
MPTASFGERWVKENLTRAATAEEIAVLNLMLWTCQGNQEEAALRARRYYKARAPGGLSDLWQQRQPDDEEILSSCQDAYIVPLKGLSVGKRRLTLIRLPAPTALDRPIAARAFLARWLMIMDIRLHEDSSPYEEIVIIDVRDLQPSHFKSHFKGSFWKDFVHCMRMIYPRKFLEVHIINVQHLKTIPLLLLHIGLYPWRRKIVQVHAHSENINKVMGVDFYPIEQLPIEYGGKAGTMKDLNDEWTAKLLENARWLQSEEKKFYTTEMKPEIKQRVKHKSNVKNLGGRQGSYDMLTRTHSCATLHKHEDFDEVHPSRHTPSIPHFLSIDLPSIRYPIPILKISIEMMILLGLWFAYGHNDQISAYKFIVAGKAKKKSRVLDTCRPLAEHKLGEKDMILKAADFFLIFTVFQAGYTCRGSDESLVAGKSIYVG